MLKDLADRLIVDLLSHGAVDGTLHTREAKRLVVLGLQAAAQATARDAELVRLRSALDGLGSVKCSTHGRLCFCEDRHFCHDTPECLAARAALDGTGDVLSAEEREWVAALRGIKHPTDRALALAVAILDRLAPPPTTETRDG